MNRIQLLLAIFCAFFVGKLCAQSNAETPFAFSPNSSQLKNFKYAVKLGGVFTLEPKKSLYVNSSNGFVLVPNPQPSFQWDRFRLGFQYQPKTGQIHEFSVMPRFNAPIVFNPVFPNQPQARFTLYQIGIGYGYFPELFKKKEIRAFAFYVGFQANPYFQQAKMVPLNTVAFSERDRTLGMQGKIVPRVAWYSSKRFFADLSVELTVADAFVGEYTTSNPTIIPANRQQVLGHFTFFPMQHSVVASIGMKL